MARQKISEHKAKVLVSKALGIDYIGWSIDLSKSLEEQTSTIGGSDKYVVKVDQGIKGRFKKGLVVLDLSVNEIKGAISNLHERGYAFFIVEPQYDHDSSEEKYLAISYDRTDKALSYSAHGGIDIEANTSTIKTRNIDDATDLEVLARETGFSVEQLNKLIQLFDQNFATLLEINPYLISDQGLQLLDLAIEVDDAGSYFVDTWSHDDFRRSSSKELTDEESFVHELDDNSPASLKLEVLNPDGSIFLLLSGGGASVVVADEIYNLGLGKELANYGEYSGNPNTEETYLYTQALIKLLLKSKASKKVLFIGGAVANFTDIANTFSGIIKAIDEMHESMSEQGVKVYVRRGGPRQEIGLAKIKQALDKYEILGAVHDPSTPLTEVVGEAVGSIQ